jgi:hypothetical protein
MAATVKEQRSASAPRRALSLGRVSAKCRQGRWKTYPELLCSSGGTWLLPHIIKGARPGTTATVSVCKKRLVRPSSFGRLEVSRRPDGGNNNTR